MGLTQEEYEALTPKAREAADKKAEQTYLEAGADYVVKDIRGILVQTATFRGQQGRISRPVKAILSGRL